MTLFLIELIENDNNKLFLISICIELHACTGSMTFIPVHAYGCECKFPSQYYVFTNRLTALSFKELGNCKKL